MHGTEVLEAQHTFSHIAGNSLQNKNSSGEKSQDDGTARRSRAPRSSNNSPRSTVRRHRPAKSTSLLDFVTKAPAPAITPSIVVHNAHKNATLAETNGNKQTTPTTSIKVSQDGKRADGKNRSSEGAAKGSTPIASSSVTNMANKLPQSLPPRPPLVSQTSNSVPSTPYQHAREFTTRSRSPSPQQHLAGSHSPRSVKSEANGYMAALPRGRPTCKYETAAAFGRRRIQYDIGDEILKKAVKEPKKSLDPNEEDKLSGDMRELYDRLLPSEESEQRRKDLVAKLDRILRKEWPGNDFMVHVFGSSGNLLCTSESDVDICIQTPLKKLETMHTLAEAMANNGMERVICIASAKVPIVKIWDPELRLACDINVNNTLALENTRMIKAYIEIDERVRPLAMIIKHWTRQRVLNDAGLGGTLSSYTWICMILNFLQTRKPPILPALHQRPHEPYIASDGSESGFSDDLEQVRDFGKENKESLASLLFHFFRQYGYEVNYEQDVISVRQGKLVSRKEKGWDHAKEAQWRLCVEEPFNTTRNLGNTADATAFRGIHLEIRQAFDYLANGVQLAKCCEQFEYPPEEKVVFKKPTPTHKPAILREPPNARSGRNMSATMRGPSNRNSPNFRSPQGNRRSSSGANYRPNQHGGYAGSLSLAGLEYPEQLQQQYLLNANRLLALKAQLNSLSPSAHPLGAGQILAQAEADTAQAQARLSLATAAASPQRSAFMNGSTTTLIGEDGRIYPAYPAAYGYPQRHPFDPTHPMSVTSSHDGSRTHPASPSLASAVPTSRRSVQRSMAPNGLQASSIRSHSQPARGIPGHMLVHQNVGYGVPPVPNYDASAYAQSTQQSSGAELPQGYSDLPLRSTRTLPMADAVHQAAPSRDYLGYYLEEAAQVQPQPTPRKQSFHLPPIPSFGEMKRQRAAAAAQDLMQVPTSIHTRRASRSPSPLRHGRSFSTASGLHTAPMTAPLSSMHLGQLPRQRFDGPQTPYAGGPIIANGSYTSTSSPPTGESIGTPGETQTDFSEVIPESFASTVNGPPHVQSAYDVFGIQPPVDIASEASRADDDPLIATANHVNELLAEAYNPKSNGMLVTSSDPVVQPLEPFPPLPQSSPELANRQENCAPPTSPPAASTPVTKSPWRAVAASRSPIPPLDLSKVSSADISKPPLSGAAPLLSPVMETRTPSPTASRSGRNTATPKSAKANGSMVIANGTYADIGRPVPIHPTVVGTNGAFTSLTNGNGVPKPRADLSQEQPAPYYSLQPPFQSQPLPRSQPPSGQWETTANRGKKKRGRAKSGPQKSGPVPGEGETMPVNEADRKGG